MFKEIIYDQNEHWKGELYQTGVKRSQFEKIERLLKLDQVITITGVRRCGKSFLLKQTINHLISKGVSASNIFFLNLEVPDLVLTKRNSKTLQDLFDIYLKEKDPDGQIYVFLDEIQFFEEWEVFIKSEYDKRKGKIKFFITGSNRMLLSNKFATMLSGRVIELVLFPFSFKEFLFSESYFDFSKQGLVHNRNKLLKHFEDYMILGGFPELLKIDEDDEKSKQELLQSYFKTIVFKDLVPIFNIRDTKSIESVGLYLNSNVSKLFSYKKIANVIGINDKTVKEFFEALEKVFLFFELRKYDRSLQKQLRNAKKAYSIDTGLAWNLGFRFSSDVTRLLENLVFIELKRRELDVYYHACKGECDFVIKEGLEISSAIQVCYKITPENKKREINGLVEAMKRYELKEGLILTLNEEEETVVKDDLKINVLPVWKWLLVD